MTRLCCSKFGSKFARKSERCGYGIGPAASSFGTLGLAPPPRACAKICSSASACVVWTDPALEDHNFDSTIPIRTTQLETMAGSEATDTRIPIGWISRWRLAPVAT